MSMNEMVNKSAAEKLHEMWGERWPRWEEFLQASVEGRVQVNKTIAAQAVHSTLVPASFRIFYGVILLWVGFLSVPIATAIWFFSEGISAWWIAIGGAVGWFLIKVSREGQCEGIKAGAENNKEFYQTLVVAGAFLFRPKA